MFALALAVLIFSAAGTLAYWQGWVFWAIISGCVFAITAYFLKHDPALVERRLRAGPAAEREARQKPVQFAASIILSLTFVVSALDHRFGWSAIPVPIVLVGDALVALGFLGVYLVFKENSFASAIIEVDADQRVVSTGPYALVRHPMYAASLLLFVGCPVALGSQWGLLAVVPLAATLIIRLLDEEKYLKRHLPGYEAYCSKVGFRLVPGIW